MLDVLTYPENSPGTIEFAMIGLHGRNADKHAFFPFVRQMGFLHTRWILPSAPFTDADPPHGRSWYPPDDDPAGIRTAREAVAELVGAQVRDGILPENIFLAGFSQGAAMALDVALRQPRRIGGVVAISGYVPWPGNLARERHPANDAMPIFIGHGLRDDVISIESARGDAAFLGDLGCRITYREYDAAHHIPTNEIRDIRTFLHRHMFGLMPDDERSMVDGLAPF